MTKLNLSVVEIENDLYLVMKDLTWLSDSLGKDIGRGPALLELDVLAVCPTTDAAKLTEFIGQPGVTEEMLLEVSQRRLISFGVNWERLRSCWEIEVEVVSNGD